MDDKTVPPEAETIPTAELIAVIRELTDEYSWCDDLEIGLDRFLGLRFDETTLVCYCSVCVQFRAEDGKPEPVRFTLAANCTPPEVLTKSAVAEALRKARLDDYSSGALRVLAKAAFERWGVVPAGTASVAR